MKLFLTVAVLLMVFLSVSNVHNIYAEKTLTITQKCVNTMLHLFITNQDGEQVKNAKIFDMTRMKVIANAGDDGLLALPAELQGEMLRVGGGSYPLVSFTAENCQPMEIKFEKSDQDLMIVHHHTWSNFDSTSDYEGGKSNYVEFTGNYIVGDIVNLSEHNLTDIQITITTFSERLGMAESQSWYPMKKILRPGEASPFFTNMGGGFDSYSIKISDYKGTSGTPITPQVEISDVRIHEDSSGVETLIVTCKNTLEQSDNLNLIMLGYSKNNLLQHAAVGQSYYMEDRDTDTSNCITDGKVSIPEFLEDAKINRFEVFIIQSDVNVLFYNVQDMDQIKNLNAYQKQNISYTQPTVYSNYFPNSLTPKYVDIDNLKTHSERLQEIKKSRLDTEDSQNKPNDYSQDIPVWIKTNADWWAQDKIDDTTFISGIKFLIENEILDIPPTSKAPQEISSEIPSWIKSNAEFWAQDLISDDDFLNGIQYLVETGIIKI